jgi:Ca2+-binding RTX toxin-like protein
MLRMPTKQSFRPSFEHLENREVPAATAVISGGDLVISGTSGADTIHIQQEYILTGFIPVRREMGVRVNIMSAGQPNLVQFFTKSQFNLIRVDSLGGSDRVTNQSSYASVLNGAGGHDSLTGGTGNDSLTGGAGNDVLDGGGGYDRLYETGNVNMILTDTALFGLGSDTLYSIDAAELTGGAGDNTLDCHFFSGPVTLYGRGGNDLLIGGSNQDYLFGEGGADQLFGEDGDDYMEGGPGADIMDGGDGFDRAKDSEEDELASMVAAILAGQPDHGVEHWTFT